MITEVAVGKRPSPVLEVEIRGNGPHTGKSQVMELIRRTLEANGYGGIKLVKQDDDQQHWLSRHDDELRNTRSDVSITLIDNNQKPVGVKA
ncbi:hypothetical protein D3C85_731990 [compost metagenome]